MSVSAFSNRGTRWQWQWSVKKNSLLFGGLRQGEEKWGGGLEARESAFLVIHTGSYPIFIGILSYFYSSLHLHTCGHLACVFLGTEKGKDTDQASLLINNYANYANPLPLFGVFVWLLPCVPSSLELASCIPAVFSVVVGRFVRWCLMWLWLGPISGSNFAVNDCGQRLRSTAAVNFQSQKW